MKVSISKVSLRTGRAETVARGTVHDYRVDGEMATFVVAGTAYSPSNGRGPDGGYRPNDHYTIHVDRDDLVTMLSIVEAANQ